MLQAIGALSFGTAALVGILLAELLPVIRLPGAPPPKEPPIVFMIAGCAAIGAFEATHNPAPLQLLLLTIVVVCLCAIWCTDARSGIVPDAFTLGPLAIVLLVSVTHLDWHTFLSAAIAFVPFAIVAALSEGIGLGWGDVKLAALGGAVLGLQTAIVVFAIACAVAAVPAIVRGRRRIPIALGPYLAGAILVGIPMGMPR